ncbi:sulfotransferase domain-containing protein [Candidatus Chloroploca sp. M-50]|uniref:Sulfotransferase domain-containing protein n=1 Tax=Candidatus Chloroploca mongolica TaxID=2528176 RepID=A0ABS4D517_9CHLR|nr:sulfotransferase domain-containing protein [Candidatus Chloroploca mongolica]
MAPISLIILGLRWLPFLLYQKHAHLQAQEEATCFRERPSSAERFFRKGKADNWREELTPAQIKRIEAEYGPVMARLGYLEWTTLH